MNRAIKVFCLCKISCRAQQHGSVAIMATAVHFALVTRLVVKLIELVEV